METLIAQGISLGFAAGAQPGPLLSYLITTTLSRGWRQALPVIFAPLITDAPIIIFTVALLGALPGAIIPLIRIAGGIFVLIIAWGAIRQFRAGGALIDTSQTAGSAREVLFKGVTMNLLSPGPYLFWATVNGPLLREGLEQSIGHGAAFLIAFYGVFLGMMAAIALIFDRLRRVDERLTRGLLLAAIVVLGGFGLYLIVQGISQVPPSG